MSLDVLFSRHRGPYRLCLTRTHEGKEPKHRYSTEWLSGEVQTEDVEAEARALLDDPRDNITSIHFWSVREDQFVGGLKK